jgi:hypothetical protein
MDRLPDLTALRDLFDYDPDSGQLLWRARGRKRRRGCKAGTPGARGYIYVPVLGRRVRAHRVIWKWAHGWEPPEIDHRDGNPANNRLANLRPAAHRLNVRNARRRAGKSLPKGVSFHRASGKYQARVRLDGRLHHLGVHVSPEIAHAAYAEAALRLHGEFARID